MYGPFGLSVTAASNVVKTRFIKIMLKLELERNLVHRAQGPERHERVIEAQPVAERLRRVEAEPEGHPARAVEVQGFQRVAEALPQIVRVEITDPEGQLPEL